MNITQILLGLILILGGVFTLVVWPYIRAHVSSEQLSMLAGIAQTVVFAAEKIFGAKMGPDKLAYALNLAKKLLEKKGLSFDEEVIRAAIEAQVQQLNLDQQAVEVLDHGNGSED
jgi:hypothetical protein